MRDFDSEYIQRETLRQCNGKQSCLVELDHAKFGSASHNFDQFLFL